MDRIRVTGFCIRQACDRLEREINAVLAGDIADPVQQRITLERCTELRHQLDTWLGIAAGELPREATYPRHTIADALPSAVPPRPAIVPDVEHHK